MWVGQGVSECCPAEISAHGLGHRAWPMPVQGWFGYWMSPMTWMVFVGPNILLAVSQMQNFRVWHIGTSGTICGIQAGLQHTYYPFIFDDGETMHSTKNLFSVEWCLFSVMDRLGLVIIDIKIQSKVHMSHPQSIVAWWYKESMLTYHLQVLEVFTRG